MGEFSLLVRMELPLSTRPPAPQPARKPPPSTGPDNTGFAVFTAGGGQVLTLNLSYSASFSRSMEQEKERRSQLVRVKQKTKNPATGKEEVNEENYVDIKQPKEILTVNNADGTEKLYRYNEPYVLDVPSNVEILDDDIKDKNPAYVQPAPADEGGGVAPLIRTVKINRRPIRRRR